VLVFGTRYFTPILLITFLAGKRLLYAIGVHTKPRPEEPPKEWLYWPTWFAGFTFYHNRLFSNLLLLDGGCVLRREGDVAQHKINQNQSIHQKAFSPLLS